MRRHLKALLVLLAIAGVALAAWVVWRAVQQTNTALDGATRSAQSSLAAPQR